MIRELKGEELPEIAQVYKASFLASHKTFLPQSFLHKVTDEYASERIHKILSSKEHNPFCFVAEQNNKVIGFAIGSFARNPPPGYDGELKMIYVLPEFQDKGFGERLLQSVAQYFLDHGVQSMFVGTFKENTLGIAFYERMAGNKISEQVDTILSSKVETVNYGWSYLSKVVTEK